MIQQEIEKLAYSPKEACHALGLSKGTLAELLRSGKLPSIRAGKRYLIPRTALEEFINGYKEGENMIQEPDIVRSQQLVNKWGDRRNLPTDADLDEVMEGAQDLQMAITNRMEALNNLTDVLKEAAKEWGPVLIGHKYQAEIEDGRIASISLRSKGDTNGQQ